MGTTQSFGDMVAVRDVAGKYIAKLGEENDKVVVVNADQWAPAAIAVFMKNFRNARLMLALPSKT